jgi:aminoglycoside phosphotransferase family enzyme
MEIAECIAALSDRAAYPDAPPSDVSIVHTHISVLFFIGERVYKVKKPVRLDFLDYSTLERRRHFCEEEVRLNRRLAPDVYLGVVGIVRSPEGAIRVGGKGRTVEYAVEMKRLPESRMMNVMLDRGEIDNEQLDAIVQLLADFHRAAATGEHVDEHARPREIARQVEQNFADLEAFTGGSAHPSAEGTLSPALHAHLRRTALQWLEDRAGLLERRVREGRVREGHGDLHTGNICLTQRGIVMYDCIEFDRRLRCRDVACELAFLAMDLDLRCFRGFAGYLIHRYSELTGDPGLQETADFYKLHLAAVRGKVASLRAADPGFPDADRRRGRAEAARYLHLAAAYTLPPQLMLMCGLPGSGKTHAARAIAPPFEAVVLRSDVIRKSLAGLAPTARSGSGPDAGIYTPSMTRRTYATLLEEAEALLRRGQTVIVDATFATAAQRRPFLEAADALGAGCMLVEMTCPEAVARERMRCRAGDADEVSEADWAVYEAARSRFEAPDDVPASRRVRVDSTRAPEEIAGAVIDGLIGG